MDVETKKKAISIAKKAGAYLLKNFRNDETLLKERGMSKEVTTKYDLESDKIILDELKDNFPEHNYLTEESGNIDNGSEYTWVIDSMDGSGNFAAGNPFFSVSIALVKADEPLLGVVYAPYLNELYVAEKGKGAYLNEKRLKVSDVSKLKDAYVVMCEGGSKDNERPAELYAKVYPKVKDMRKIGSAAIESGLVASGRADIYMTLNISPWDVAAGVLLVKEAGGIVRTFDCKEWSMKNHDIIMTNAKLEFEL